MQTQPSALTQVLLEELNATAQDWDVDELAFLSATSKVEHPIRDRLAWRLQQRARPVLHVAREWKRADLALLVGGVPLALIEAKALYSFDVLQPAALANYLSRIAADLGKARALAPAAAHYALVLVTHVADPVHAGLMQIVKYSTGINRAHAAPGSYGMAERARLKLRTCLVGLGEVHQVEFGVGLFHGVPVSVYAYLVHAVPQPGPIDSVECGGDPLSGPAICRSVVSEQVAGLFRPAKPYPPYEPHPVSNARTIRRWVTPFYLHLLDWETAQLRGEARSNFVRDAAAALPWFCLGVADELYSIPNWRTALAASFFLLLQPELEGGVGGPARMAARRGWGHGVEMYLLALAVRDETEVLEEIFMLEPDSRPWLMAALTVGGWRCHRWLSQLSAAGERLDDALAAKARDVLDLVLEVRAAERTRPT